MATIRRRKGSGIWYLNYSLNGKQYERSTRTRDRKLALIRLHEIELKLFRGELDNSPEHRPDARIRDFFRRFMNDIEGKYARWQMEQRRLLRWQEYFIKQDILMIGQIHPGHVQDFYATVLTNHSEKTKANYLGLLKRCLNCAVEWQVIEVNPIAKVKPPKTVRKFHYFSKEEIALLIDNASEPLRTAIIILVNTGLRRSELYNLRWRDVDLKHRKLTVMPHCQYKTKSRKPRTIPLNKSALAAFRSLDNSDEYAFRPRSIGNFTDRFRELVCRLNLSGSLHSLRHSFASHLVMAGVGIPEVKELLGHSDITTTMIYAHLAPDHLSKTVDKLKF